MSHNSARFLERILIFILLFFPPFLLLSPQPDNDTYWLIRMGEYISRYGIPATEPLSIHTGLAFYPQQWLSSLVFYFIYKAAGFWGIYFLLLSVYLIITYLIYRFALLLSNGNKPVALSIAVACSLSLFTGMHARPQIFSYLLFLWELILLEKFVMHRQATKKTYLYALGLMGVSFLLINLHAALWLMFFLLLLPYIFEGFKKIPIPSWLPKPEGYGTGKILFILLLCFLAGLFNPQGITSMGYIFKSYGNRMINAAVSEMKSPDFKEGLGIIVFIIYLTLISAYFIIKGRTKLRYILLTVGMAYLGLSSVRNLPLFIITAYPLLAYYAKDVKLPVKKKTAALLSKKWPQIIAVSLIILVMGALVIVKASQPDSIDSFTPIGAVAYIKKNLDTEKMRIFNDYNSGGYLAFNYIRTFIDSRAEVYTKRLNQKADILKDYFNIYGGEVYYKDIFKKYRLTHALVYKKLLINTLLKRDPDFVVLYRDKEYVLYEYRGRE